MKRDPALQPYDPATYWNERARRFAGDPTRAVCLDDADENRCIDRIQRHLLQAALQRIESRTPLPGKTVLDYGCGSGRWVTFLRDRGLVYSGVDIAAQMLALARRGHLDADFRAIEDHDLPYPDKHFDLVWSVAVIHHNPYDAQEQVVREMARVLRDDGTLILFEGLGAHAPSGNYYPRLLQEWVDLAGRNGLTCTWQRGGTYALLRPLVNRVAPWRRVSAAGLLTRLDAIATPHLLAFVPPRYHTRAVMLFQRVR